MNYSHVISELTRNKLVFMSLLSGLKQEEYLWKSSPDKWCILEIVCHLYDEEREDFRARTQHILDSKTSPLQSIDPPYWVMERKYIEQNFSITLESFLNEREKSVQWLNSLKSPNWENTYDHPKFGKMTAKMFLSNWLAHDYLHIRQIIKLKFDYLGSTSEESLSYAGEW